MLKIIDDDAGITNKQWADYIMNNEFGNIFNTPEFFNLHKLSGETEPGVVCALENGEIKGLLTYYIHKEKKFLLGKLTSRTIIWGSPVFDSSADILKSLLKEYLIRNKKKTIYSQIRNIYDTNEYKSVFQDIGFDYNEHLNILFDLTKGEDNLWMDIHKYRKKEIRNCYKKGISVRLIQNHENDLLLKAYEMIFKLYKKLYLPVYSKNFFDIASKILFPLDYLKVFGAFLDKKLIGVRYILCYKNMLYDWFAGSDEDYLKFKPNDVLPWEVIKWGANNGFEIFDFGGAGKPGVYYGVREYKQRFGGKFVNYGRYENVHKSYLMKIGVFGNSLRKKFTAK